MQKIRKKIAYTFSALVGLVGGYLGVGLVDADDESFSLKHGGSFFGNVTFADHGDRGDDSGSDSSSDSSSDACCGDDGSGSGCP